MKKLILLSLLTLAFISSAKAYSEQINFKGGAVIDGMFIKKVSESQEEAKKAQFIIDDAGDYVYCLEPFAKVKKGASYEVYDDEIPSALNIGQKNWKKINLIAYYGYEYVDENYNHTDPKWYYITQMLMWREIEPNAGFYFTDTFDGNINNELYQNEINEIYTLVNNHFLVPNFNFDSYIIGDTITITDTNHVLSGFKSSDNVSIDQDNLSLKVTNENMEFSLDKILKPTKALVYMCPDSQNIIKGKMTIPVHAKYELKASLPTGSINIKKYGELFKNENQSFSYEYKALSGVEITLLDENQNVLATKITSLDGLVTFQDLPSGKYYIKESKTVNGYVLDAKVYEVSLLLGKDNRVIDENLELYNDLEKKTLIISKKDEKTGLPIKDVEFTVYDELNNVIFIGKTDEAGKIIIKNLSKGKYHFEETKAAPGYIENKDSHDVFLDNDTTALIFNIPNTGLTNVNTILFSKKFDY